MLGYGIMIPIRSIRKIRFLKGNLSFAKEKAAKLEVIVPTIVTENDTMIEFFIPDHSWSSSNNLSYASVRKGAGIHSGGNEKTPLLSLNEVETIHNSGAIITIAPINSTKNIIVLLTLDSLFI